MKICFSTLGCPNWMWQEVTSAAKDIGYDGIELRGLGEDLFIPNIRVFSPENVAATKRELDTLGLEISCVSSDCRLNLSDRDYIAEGIAHISLARSLGSKYMRVMGDSWGPLGGAVDMELVRSRLSELAGHAAESGVTLLLESNGAFSDTAVLREMIESVGGVMALWDIQHPYRNFGEPPEKTWQNIGKYVRHVHFKDSVVTDGKIVYRMLGYGDLPVKSCIKTLKAAGFDGYASLEWYKRYNFELEDPGIVFSHYAYTMKKLLRES